MNNLNTQAVTLEKPIKSPCVSICALDIDDICMGCLRSGDEIRRWGKMTNSEKQTVLDNIRQRAAS